MSEVIALAGFPPEVLAYAFAMYSRSSLSVRESLKKITEEKSEEFLEKYYFQYGHASIADNAHIALALENISQIAVFELEDQQLWDGQERSTRYQSFKKDEGFFIPNSIRHTILEEKYISVANFLLSEYEFFSRSLFEWFVKNNPKPNNKSQDQYEKALQARAFDVARYFLFGGILTSAGQITNARALESQIVRFMSSPYEEMRNLGQSMKLACSSKPLSPEGKEEPPVAPTLVKYTNPSIYLMGLEAKIKKYTDKLLPRYEILNRRYVDLVRPSDTLDEIVATLLYQYSQASYADMSWLASDIPSSINYEILESVAEIRGDHDALSRHFQAGHSYQFEIVIDRGALRDLHRHRRCTQIIQSLTTKRGFDTPDILESMGLVDRYQASMRYVGNMVEELRDSVGIDADYLIPFAYRCGALFKMDFAEAAYMIELRSGVNGHFSYRKAVCDMHDLLSQCEPHLAKYIRVTPYEQEDLLNR